MTLRKLTEVGDKRGFCCATIHIAETHTITRDMRERYARRTGRPAEECGRRADYEMDGQRLCRNHAGQRALRRLIEGGGTPP